MPVPVRFIEASGHAVTATRSKSAQLVGLDGDRYQKAPGRTARLTLLRGVFDTIAGGAAKVTVGICADTAADEPLVSEVEVSIQTGVGTATDGGVGMKIDLPIVLPSNADIRVTAKTDAGSLTAKWQLHYVEGGI